MSASRRLRIGGTLLVGALLAVTRAHAAPTELDTLERELDEDDAALATGLGSSDCQTACRALASMRRAADKICALAPGPRCEAARAKAADALARVKKTCPACAAATESPPPPPPPEAPPAVEDQGVRPAQAAPPAESPKGGCASCATAGSLPASDAGIGIAATFALAHLLRRRKRPVWRG
jgi:hypothetical protein